MTNPSVKGPYNVAAPSTATNADFTAAMGSVLSRPTLLPFPGFAAKALFGQMVPRPPSLAISVHKEAAARLCRTAARQESPEHPAFNTESCECLLNHRSQP